MKLYREVSVDLVTERDRVTKVRFTAAQRARLIKAIDLFEAGKFQECAEFVSAWGRTKDEYPEQEHLGIEMSTVLRDMFMCGEKFLRFEDGKLIPANTKVTNTGA